jgi:transcription antitermination factor NusG
MAVHWYVLRSKPHKERALFRYAKQEGFEVFYPSFPVNPVNPRASKIRPYFPGYMFLQADIVECGESAFHWMPFSQGLVRFGGDPATVDESFMRVLMMRISEIRGAGGLVFDGLQPGDPVEIKSGMFEGYQAIFDHRLSGVDRVHVLLQMLCERYVPLEIAAGAIKKMVSV